MSSENPPKAHQGHPAIVRLTHWVNAFAMVCMVTSGMGIYNAHPILPFSFPPTFALGGWLGGSIAWHFAVMWLFVGNGLIYLLFGFASGYLRQRLLSFRFRDILRDLRLALTLRLPHRLGTYNAVQKVMYVAAFLLGVMMLTSGLAIWKPVQLAWLTSVFGGFEGARVMHFFGMAALLCFAIIHLVMVVLVPKTLVSMVVGSAAFRKTEGTEDER